ncbi:hypothetical protein MSAN_01615600 [Mycena sanguinolenta]|uniref:Uncharacterized protein n=1 Tax=Mycena sanguinolenta TaxID=230812 RepID=A0A8H7CU57_9AGAR|nr:hypothetical protein MSAN_01615600 [Mycena sanguinolenta]
MQKRAPASDADSDSDARGGAGAPCGEGEEEEEGMQSGQGAYTGRVTEWETKKGMEEEGEEHGENEEEGDGEDVQARMEMVMREAAAEDDEDGEDEDEGEDDGDSEIRDVEGDSDEGSQDDDPDENDDDKDDSNTDARMPANPHRLPDNLFASAFASTYLSLPGSKNSSKNFRREPKVKAKKRKRSMPRTKDWLALPPHNLCVRNIAPAPVTLPSRKIRKFPDRALALKVSAAAARGKKNEKGWERVPESTSLANSEPRRSAGARRMAILRLDSCRIWGLDRRESLSPSSRGPISIRWVESLNTYAKSVGVVAASASQLVPRSVSAYSH